MAGSARAPIIFLTVGLAVVGACSSDEAGGGTPDELRSVVTETAEEAVSIVRGAAEELGEIPVQDLSEDEVTSFVDDVLNAGKLFPAAAEDMEQPDRNTFVFVGMYLAVSTTAKGPGADPEDVASERLDELFEAADRENVGDFDDEELQERTEILIRPLAYTTLLTTPAVIKQLAPMGSPQAERFNAWLTYDDGGNPVFKIPAPTPEEARVADPASWGSFVKRIVAEQDLADGNPLSDVLTMVNDEIERST